MIEIRQTRCTRYRFRYSECRRCADACPHEAIAFSDEGARVDASRCRGCSLCESACRTGAWESPEMPRVDLLKRAIKSAAWSFACAPSGLAADAIVPCLGALDAAMLAYLGKRAIPVELRGTGKCATCEHGSRGPAMIEDSLEAVNLLREASGEAWADVTVSADLPGDRDGNGDYAPGRRHLFRRLLGGLANEVARANDDAIVSQPVPDKAIRAARPHLTEMRELLQIVARTAERGPFPVSEHDALPVMRLSMGDGCTACEACFRACPTGALQVRETDAAWSLTFRTDACVGCATCLEVCQPHALRTHEIVDIAPGSGEATLRTLVKQRCCRCDRSFASATPAQACAVCADDETAFDAIFG